MKKKLSLGDLKVKSFPTAKVMAHTGGLRDSIGKVDTNCNVCTSGFPIYC